MVNLNFNNENATFLFLNIIGHDVIHDYGIPDSDRWSNNQKYLKEFYNTYTISPIEGGTKTRTITRKRTGKRTETEVKHKLNKVNRVFTLKLLDDKMLMEKYYMENELNIFINQIKSDILLHSFKYIILNYFDTQVQFELLPYYIIRYKSLENTSENTLENIYYDIAEYFWSFINLYYNINQYDILYMLTLFFEKDYVKLAIYKNVDLDSYTGGMNEQKGGKLIKPEFLTITECTKLLNEINEQFIDTESIFNLKIIKLQRFVGKIHILPEDINTFNTYRNEIINVFKTIFTENGCPKTANCLQSIPVLGSRGFRNIDLKTKIKDIINDSIIDYRVQFDSNQMNEKRIKAKQDADLLAESRGQLTSDDKNGVKDFIVLIARMALISTNTNNNNIDSILKLPEKSALKKEIDILYYIAGIPLTIKNADLDSNLYSFFYDNYKDYKMTERYKCSKPTNQINDNKYIINNASHIEASTVKEYGFCPYSSIIDGMSQCSWNTSEFDGREYGNMNFKIVNKNNENNTDNYYNGIINILDNNNVNIALNIQLPNLIVNKTKNINITNSTGLEAWVVLKDTLIAMLKYITDANNISIFNGITANNKIFENLIAFPDIFPIIYENILFKGVGDLFQEINAVAKNGGYIDNYNADDRIKKYGIPSIPDPIRLFVANDRPSACRFMFMLINGNETEINKRAFGGYFTKSQDPFLIKRPENEKVCETIYIAKGGGKKRTFHKKRARNTKSIKKTRKQKVDRKCKF